MRPDALPTDTQALNPLADAAAAERLLRMQGLVLESMREGVSVADETGTIIYTNPAEDRMFGYAPGELIGQHVTVQNTYPPGTNARMVAEVIEHLRSHGVWEGEWENVRKDGTPFATHARITALEHEGRSYWVCVQEDVTARRRAEERIRRTQEVTALLVGAQTPEQVAEVMAVHGIPALGAAAGSIARLSDDGSVLNVVRSFGYPDDAVRRWAQIPLDRNIPLSAAIRLAQPIFVTSPEEWDARFEPVAPLRALQNSRAWAAIPFVFGGRVLGAMGLSFLSEHALDEDDRAAALALAQQCTQALERARLGEGDRLVRERLRLATEAARIGTFDWHAPSGRVSWTEEEERLFGLAPGTFEGTLEAWERRLLSEDLAKLKQRVGDAVARRASEIDFEFRIRRADGAVRLIEGSASFFYDDDGTLLRMVGVNMDVTERRRAQRAAEFLAEASRVLASSLDYETTLRNLAVSAVPRLGDWCGIDMIEDPERGEWPPRVRRIATVHQNPERVALAEELRRRYPVNWSRDAGLARVLRTGQLVYYPEFTDAMLRSLAQDEEHLRLLQALQLQAAIVVPLVARGRVLGALTLVLAESGGRYDQADVALAEDLAGRAAVAVDNARLYREAQEASRAKTQFLATMSHELRTPLNAIDGYAELMELGIHGPVSPAQRDALGRLRRSQKHLLGLINEVLNYTRVEAGAVRYELVDVAMADVLGAVEGMLAPQMRAKGLHYAVERCDAGLAIHADPEKTQQILVNLLTNAVKFTPAGGRVRVACEDAGAMVQVRVSDTGVGIPAEKLEAIFEPFVQVDARLTRTQEGVGLGLAISRDLARGMNGDITAACVPGEGATFTLTLPRAVGSG